MYLGLFAVDLVVTALLLLTSLLAVWSIGRGPRQTRMRGLRRNARTTRFALCLSAVLVLAKFVIGALFLAYGWDFAATRLLVGVPLLALAVVAVMLLTAPRLRVVAGRPVADRQALCSDAERVAAAHPALVVPVRGLAIVAVAELYLVLVPPVWPMAALLAVFCTGAYALLWWWQSLRWQIFARHGTTAERPLQRAGNAIAVTLAALIAVVGALGLGQQTSKLPGRVNMVSAAGHAGHGNGQRVSVTSLTGLVAGGPVRQFTLTAEEAAVPLDSGATVAAWTFNGTIPGPVLRVTQGEIVEVTLVNHLAVPTTIHWHGIDVPNAMDGVAGVTQDAVPPGGQFVYRFRADRAGTYWYHSHQLTEEQVHRGLFGALIVLPAAGIAADEDMTLLAHTWRHTDRGERFALNGADNLARWAVTPGRRVRLRLVNTDDDAVRFTLAGVPFRVVAIDGADLNAPTDLTNAIVSVPAGAKYDLAFTMPDQPVQLRAMDHPEIGLLLSRDDTGSVPPIADGPELDITRYGSPGPTAIDPAGRFDRQYTIVLNQQPGFYNGQFGLLSTVNGLTFPNSPMLMVREGDLVKITFRNEGIMDHPMHLHGHHWLVLSHNGKVATGSPLWLDTVNVRPGETWELAFRADNPGIWMDHCHTLWHAAAGMALHIAYEGITTPFDVGDESGNHPE